MKTLARKAVDATGSELLEQLHRGEITFDTFVEGKVERQVALLEHFVPQEERDFFRNFIREQILTSPVLNEYLKLATGVDTHAFEDEKPPEAP